MKSKILFFFLFITLQYCFSQTNILENITIRGAKKINIAFLKKIIQADNSKVLDSVVLKQDIIRLKRLPSIAHAFFQVFPSDKNNSYNVFIDVKENITLIPELNIWTTTNRRTAYKVSINEFNFLKRNIQIGAYYQNNGYHSYGLHLKAPYLFSKKLGISIAHQNYKSEEPLYFGTGTANYLYHNNSMEILGLYEINFKNTIQLGANYFNEKYTHLSGNTTNAVPQFISLDKMLFKTVYTFDNLDYHYQYINGFKSEFYGQLVTTIKAYERNFLIAWNNFYYYKRIGNKGNWANRIRFGLSTNKKSPFAPFVVDNNVNIRGVGILTNRGTGTFIWNTEYRHTIYENTWFALQSNVFVDIGTWRKPGKSLNNFFNKENKIVYSGIGLRLIHKKIYGATLRVDYGYGLTPNSSKGLVFGIGQYF